MFLGEFAHSLDDKGRLTLPAKFRARLAEGLVMTTGADNCLLVYPMDEFSALFEKVSALPMMGRDAANLRRLLFTNAHDALPDKQNRVIIPQHLREYAGIAGEAIVVGVGKYIEIWNPEAWQNTKVEVQSQAANKDVWRELGI
jgi:MraZ protein